MTARKSISAITLALGLSMLGHAAHAQGIDPNAPCGQVLRDAGDNDKLLAATWTLGYLAGKGQAGTPVDQNSITQTLTSIFEGCIANDGLTLVELADRSLAESGLMGTVGSEQAGEPGTRADAERLLRRFLEPDADRVALTASLKPSPEDVHAVYSDPLGSRLADAYEQMFSPDAQFGPKSNQDALLIVHATTTRLLAGDPVLEEFPGGYKSVLPYMKKGYPIVRFKFVEQGETMGLAFDGLIFVNGRWVLMPKPWRMLD